MDLVLNHTSDDHPWFKVSRSDKNSPYRDYYVWSDTDQKYKDTRIIFLDTEPSNWTLDEKTGQYYWHRFYASQPDLNFDNPRVQEEMFNVARFWLDLGIDGFRADAVPYLFERGWCENLPGRTYLKLRSFMDKTIGRTYCAKQISGLRMPSILRWRRIPHGFPLPHHAAHLHGAQKRSRGRYDRDPASNTTHP
jgi:glycosidase